MRGDTTSAALDVFTAALLLALLSGLLETVSAFLGQTKYNP